MARVRRRRTRDRVQGGPSDQRRAEMGASAALMRRRASLALTDPAASIALAVPLRRAWAADPRRWSPDLHGWAIPQEDI